MALSALLTVPWIPWGVIMTRAELALYPKILRFIGECWLRVSAQALRLWASLSPILPRCCLTDSLIPRQRHNVKLWKGKGKGIQHNIKCYCFCLW